MAKLFGTSWGCHTNVPTPDYSILALLYNGAEYCAPVVMTKSAHCIKVYIRPNCEIHIISDTVWSTQTVLLPILFNVVLPT